MLVASFVYENLLNLLAFIFFKSWLDLWDRSLFLRGGGAVATSKTAHKNT